MKATSNELVKVPFHGGHVLVVKDGDEERIIVKTVCDILTVDPNGQAQRIKREPRLATWACKIHVVGFGSQKRGDGVLTIPRKKLPAFLYGLQPTMVRDEKIRENLIQLQEELEDVMDSYFVARVAGVSHEEFLATVQRLEAKHDKVIAELGMAHEKKVTSLQAQVNALYAGVLRGDQVRWVVKLLRHIGDLTRFKREHELSEDEARGRAHQDARDRLNFHALPWCEFPASRFAGPLSLRAVLRRMYRTAKRDALARGYATTQGDQQPPIPGLDADPFVGDADDEDEAA